MMKLHTQKVWNAVTALSHYSVTWTSVVTCKVKCLTLSITLCALGQWRPTQDKQVQQKGDRLGH